MATKNISTLVLGLMGAAFFKLICNYISTYRETASVLREIDEKMEEIRNTWRCVNSHEEFIALVGRDMDVFFKDYDEWKNFFDCF
ncbi:hypothetical protein ACE6H2_010092 [Prunus campanulata]